MSEQLKKVYNISVRFVVLLYLSMGACLKGTDLYEHGDSRHAGLLSQAVQGRDAKGNQEFAPERPPIVRAKRRRAVFGDNRLI